MDVDETDEQGFYPDVHSKEAPEHQHMPSEFFRPRPLSGSRRTSSLSSSSSIQQHHDTLRSQLSQSQAASNTQGTAWTSGTCPYPPAQRPRHSTPNSEYSSTEYSPSPSRLNSPGIPHNSHNSTHQFSGFTGHGTQRSQELTNMSVEELLWIPSISVLYRSHETLKDKIVNMSASITASMDMQTQMYNEISSLRKRLDRT